MQGTLQASGSGWIDLQMVLEAKSSCLSCNLGSILRENPCWIPSLFSNKLSSFLLNVHMREGGKEKDDVVNTCGDLVGDRLLFRGEFKGGIKVG